MINYVDSKGALALLRKANVVAVPTETVYGLAADITQASAIRKIYDLKNRPLDHPLIVHVANMAQLEQCVKEQPPYLSLLINAFWPGPLTFVLKKTDFVSDAITGQQNTVGIRMPAHPLTRQLIEELGHPIAAPSANKYESISPTQPAHVAAEFGNELAILDGGHCTVGIESTIIDATHDDYFSILRPGMISAEDLQRAVGDVAKCKVKAEINHRVSGNKKKHYSPKKRLLPFQDENELAYITTKYAHIAVLALHHFNTPTRLTFQLPTTPAAYAQVFYHHLRLADQSEADVIAIELPPKTEGWQAIHDKINKASA